jgi:hypothetical protein
MCACPSACAGMTMLVCGSDFKHDGLVCIFSPQNADQPGPPADSLYSLMVAVLNRWVLLVEILR